MAELTISAALEAWDSGFADGPTGRAVRLAALLGDPPTDVRRWPVGRRDAAVLRVRERLFGPACTAASSCPRCRCVMELQFSTADFLAAETPGPASATFEAAGFRVEVRPPTTADVERHVRGGPAALLAACLSAADADGRPIPLSLLPAEARAEAERAVADLDRLADIRLAAGCDACGAEWEERFDPPEFLWAELDAWARRMLREVHLLARGYGWCEGDILALSHVRRAYYLELLST